MDYKTLMFGYWIGRWVRAWGNPWPSMRELEQVIWKDGLEHEMSRAEFRHIVKYLQATDDGPEAAARYLESQKEVILK